MSTAKADTVIVDLDGTLADGRWRIGLMPPPDQRHIDTAWLEFNRMAAWDFPITGTVDVVRALAEAGYRIVILTGRGAATREITEQWLENWAVPYDKLIMREVGDCRPDTEIKLEALESLGGPEYVLCAFDDLPHIVDLWRSKGITTYEVTRYEPDDHYVQANQKQGDA